MKTRQEQNVEKPSERGFGITFAAVFFIIGFLRLYKVHDLHDYWWMTWLCFSAVFIILAYFWVAPLRPLNNLWYHLGLILSYLINPILMGIVFLLTIFPIGLFMRLLKKDLLKLKFDRKWPTYWQIRTHAEIKRENMKNQF
ncbi:MAG: hypothetical protein KGZ69_04805 [Methylomonas sp.]|nr:hypothetical protein [Methylomonas sp.]